MLQERCLWFWRPCVYFLCGNEECLFSTDYPAPRPGNQVEACRLPAGLSVKHGEEGFRSPCLLAWAPTSYYESATAPVQIPLMKARSVSKKTFIPNYLLATVLKHFNCRLLNSDNLSSFKVQPIKVGLVNPLLIARVYRSPGIYKYLITQFEDFFGKYRAELAESLILGCFNTHVWCLLSLLWVHVCIWLNHLIFVRLHLALLTSEDIHSTKSFRFSICNMELIYACLSVQRPFYFLLISLI